MPVTRSKKLSIPTEAKRIAPSRKPIPTEKPTAPTEEGIPTEHSTEKPTALIDEVTPTEEPTVPTDEAIPTEEPTVPTDEAIPTEDPTVPTDEAIPTEEPTVPTDEAIPTEEPTVPTDEAIPTEEPTVQTDEEIPTEESTEKLTVSTNTEELTKQSTGQSPNPPPDSQECASPIQPAMTNEAGQLCDIQQASAPPQPVVVTSTKEQILASEGLTTRTEMRKKLEESRAGSRGIKRQKKEAGYVSKIPPSKISPAPSTFILTASSDAIYYDITGDGVVKISGEATTGKELGFVGKKRGFDAMVSAAPAPRIISSDGEDDF